MHFPSQKLVHCRGAFTLVELLVVLAIMISLAALAVAFVPNVAEAERAARGADRLQGWLLIARQQAKHDGVPTGLRLNPGTLYPNTAAPNSFYVTELQYIQKPGDFWLPNTFLSPVAGSGGLQLTASPASLIDFTGGLGAQQLLWPVQPGDYLELQGGGPVHQIASVGPQNLALVSATTLSAATAQYRVIRSPRILNGENTLSLPQNVAIDLSTNVQYKSGLPGLGSPLTQPIDILFSPSGTIVGTAYSKLIFWVRDVTQDANNPGGQTLVTVYCRTGFIAAQPVDTSSGNPYSFTQDGRSSGM
jgi:type II secretory pathway pseudopilin PulG